MRARVPSKLLSLLSLRSEATVLGVAGQSHGRGSIDPKRFFCFASILGNRRVGGDFPNVPVQKRDVHHDSEQN